MIILNLKDGLGNQMLEYGFAKHLAKKCGDKIAINNFFFDGGKRKSYSLYHFKLNDDVVVFGKLKQKWYFLSYMTRLFFCYPKVFIKWMTSNKRPKDEKTFAHSQKKGMYVHFNTFHKFDIIPSKKKNKYVYGNYEHYDYIEDVLPELREEFKIISPPSEENKKMIEKLSSCESVCVHIRRGDYLDPQWSMLNVCDEEFYKNAINKVHELHPNAEFYIFSNTHKDLEWIKENYHFDVPCEYVDLGNPDYEELRLMQCCTHFIISNSTFSWWAAVLADKEDKTVVAPTPWVLNDKEGDSEGMYLPGWIKM